MPISPGGNKDKSGPRPLWRTLSTVLSHPASRSPWLCPPILASHPHLDLTVNMPSWPLCVSHQDSDLVLTHQESMRPTTLRRSSLIAPFLPCAIGFKPHHYLTFAHLNQAALGHYSHIDLSHSPWWIRTQDLRSNNPGSAINQLWDFWEVS